MKITFIIQDLFQQGAQYVTALMATGFYEKGYEVDILVSKAHEELLNTGHIPFEVPSAVKFLVMPSRRARYNISFIHSYIRTATVDAVVVMNSAYLCALALASIGLRHKTRYCYVEHNSILPELADNISITKRIINKLIRSRYDCFMSVSKGSCALLERLMGLNEGTVKAVYNPVLDTSYYDKLTKEPSCDWLRNKAMPTMVAAGAFCKVKGHYMIFEAIRLANEKIPVRLVLFGKGALQQDYEKWIAENHMQDRIRLAGQSTSLPSEIKCADAFLVSSEMESFSIVLVEAMAAGIPVISTSCPYGPPELLKNGQYGVLVPVNDSKAMAEAIVNQVENPRKPAPREAWEPFTVQKVVFAYEKAIGLI